MTKELLNDEEIREGIETLVFHPDNYHIVEPCVGAAPWTEDPTELNDDVPIKILDYLRSKGWMSRAEINQWLGEKRAYTVQPQTLKDGQLLGDIVDLRLEEK